MILLLYTANDVKLDRNTFEYYLNTLPTYLHEKIIKYERWQDSQASLYGKLLLKYLLANYQKEFTLNDLKFNKQGKPYINRYFDFNISHAGSYVVCGYSDMCRIGVDIEIIKKEIDLNIFDDIFNQNEINGFKYCKNPYELFYDYWTIKEAAIKADGRGLSIPLKNVMITNDTVFIDEIPFYVKKINCIKGYVMHIVVEKPLVDLVQINQLNLTPLKNNL